MSLGPHLFFIAEDVTMLFGPLQIPPSRSSGQTQDGMTLRYWFARMSIVGIPKTVLDAEYAPRIAKPAYKLADAMLYERCRSSEGN